MRRAPEMRADRRAGHIGEQYSLEPFPPMCSKVLRMCTTTMAWLTGSHQEKGIAHVSRHKTQSQSTIEGDTGT